MRLVIIKVVKQGYAEMGLGWMVKIMWWGEVGHCWEEQNWVWSKSFDGVEWAVLE